MEKLNKENLSFNKEKLIDCLEKISKYEEKVLLNLNKNLSIQEKNTKTKRGNLS